MQDEFERTAEDLAEAVLASIRSWARTRNQPQVPATLPLAALLKVLVRMLQELPVDRQRANADDFIHSLNLALRKGAN